MNYKNCCLTCLDDIKEKRSIYSTITIAGDDIRLSDILQNFYNYKVSDDQFPENICITCTHQLTVTYSFKALIDATNKTLMEKIYSTASENHCNDNSIDSEEQEESEKLIYNSDIQLQSKNRKRIVQIFCVECKSKFSSVQDLNEHCTNNHPVKSFTGRNCDYCSEKFEDFRSLVLHRKQHFKPYICENCWDGFYSTQQLDTHSCLQTHRAEDLEPDRVLKQCHQCGKSYPPGYIRMHMLTHGDNRPYHCKLCPKKFKVPGGLNSHVLWNHKRTRNHKCEICKANFISSSSRSAHIRKNHLKEKKYACKCGKRYFSKSELERHTLTHTGIKNFHCHMCEKSYQTRHGLNVHLKSHSQIRVYSE